MATKKSFFVLLGLFFITAGFLGFANGVGAETLKLQVSNVVIKVEAMPVENIAGYAINPLIRDGLFVSENGELGSTKFIGVGTGGPSGMKDTSFSGFLGYAEFIFGDGSTIVGKLSSGSWWPDPEGKVMGLQKASGELLAGSGRFKGIKGTISMDGKMLKLTKGEIAPKGYNAFTLEYTLSP